MLPAFYFLMVAFRVAGIALLAASLTLRAFPSRVCFLLELHFSLFYFILFYFFSADRDKSSS